MNLEDIISNFCDEHPIWTGILARLVISICVCTIAALVFFGIIFAFAPFVLIFNDGAGAEAFAWWFLIPLIATAIWVLCSVIGIVWEAVVE